MIWIVGIVCLLVGFVFGVLMTFGSSREKYGNWKPISMSVVSKATDMEYHADRYKLNLDDNTPYLRIYNIRRFEWFPIWHFKNPYLIMMAVDPEYAKTNMLNLFSIGMAQKLTEADKK